MNTKFRQVLRELTRERAPGRGKDGKYEREIL
jgi:hypothetical protein